MQRAHVVQCMCSIALVLVSAEIYYSGTYIIKQQQLEETFN